MTQPTHAPLTPADLEVLEFAHLHFKYVNTRAHATLERFGHDVTRYYQRLHALLRHPDAMAYDPELVARTRRILAARGAWRQR